MLTTFVKLGFLPVKRAELERRLEHVRDSIVEDLVPEKDAVVRLHELIFHVKAVPTFLEPVIL